MKVKIGNHHIGEEHPCFIVAEMSANHCGSWEKAELIVHAAAEAGADAIKLQTYTAESLTIDSNKPYFQIKGHPEWSGQTLYELYKKAAMPWEWHEPLIKLANQLGMECFSTPFDEKGVEYLSELDTTAYKIASFEAVDYKLIELIAQQNKPIIMSTGMCTKDEISAALQQCRQFGIKDIVLLKCISAYPAPIDEMNLKTMQKYTEDFSIIPGLSDHSPGHLCAVTATALGAKLIEKHFILDHNDPSPDASFSMDPNEFKLMVDTVRQTEAALGQVTYGPRESEKFCLENRRSLFAVKDINAGEVLHTNNVKAIRPGHGLHPKYLNDIINKKAEVAIEAGEPIKAEYVSDFET